MDQAIRYKRLVKGVAHKHGMLAASWPSRSTTWPAPACTCTSAWPTNKATTCSPATTPPARRCCARRSAACSPACSTRPAVLSQRQLLPALPGQQLRAAGADLGVDNRTVSLRVPGGPASSRHIEHRICGADANPYLAAAALRRGPPRHPRRHRSGRAGGGQWLRPGRQAPAHRLADRPRRPARPEWARKPSASRSSASTWR